MNPGDTPLVKIAEGRYATKDDLVEVYQCRDDSWRVAYYPFADKDRNLTKDQAFALAETRHTEAVACNQATQ